MLNIHPKLKQKTILYIVDTTKPDSEILHFCKFKAKNLKFKIKNNIVKKNKKNLYNIENIIYNVNIKKNIFQNKLYFTNTHLLFLKYFYLNNKKKNKLHGYFIDEILENITNDIKKLWFFETNILFNNKNIFYIFNNYNKKINKFSIFINRNLILDNNLNRKIEIKNISKQNIFYKHLFNLFFVLQLKLVNKNENIFNIEYILKNVLLSNYYYKNYSFKQKLYGDFNLFLKNKFIVHVFKNKNIAVLTPKLLNFVSKKKINLKKIIWKKNNLLLKDFIFYNNLQKNKFFSEHNVHKKNLLTNLAYIINKIEDKHEIIKKNSSLSKKILNLRNILIKKWKSKLNRQRGTKLILSTIRDIKNFQAFKWRKYFKNILLNKIKENKFLKLKPFIKSFLKIKLKKKKKISKIKYNINKYVAKFFKKAPKKEKKKRLPLKIRFLFKNKKIIQKNEYKSYLNSKDALDIFFNKKVSIFYINALSFSRYGFKLKNKLKNSKLFLQKIERELINKFKYVATYIQDLVHISFISLFLKKPYFLAKFIAFQIENLPRNRKETRLIKFIIKTVKIFASQRRETLGIKLKFKGRVNRWRRTKFIVGQRGTLNLHTHSQRIEFGSSKSINRKGALGVSFWISYKLYFQNEFEEITKSYIKYSKYLYANTLKKYYILYSKKLKNNIKINND